MGKRSGRKVSEKDLHGKVWVASFVFTRCTGPCPQVTATVTRLQDELNDPGVVFVTFTVPAVHLSTIKQHMADGQLSVTAVPQEADAQPAVGKLTFIDNLVDTTTDTIRLKATLPNPDRRLWPGQFARVNLRLATLPHAIVVPAQAVQTGQDGQYVFVVKENSTVEQRPVTSAQRADQDVVIAKGLRPGETVVTEGQLRLEPGSHVTTDLNAAPGGGGRGRGGRAGRGR